MNRITTLISLVFLFYSCTPKEVRPPEANMYCKDFFVKGTFKNDTYYFCSIVPLDHPYLYKDGKWKYWNLAGNLVAEGIYSTKIDTITDHGGCSYYKKKGIIDINNWEFWDEHGQQIQPDDKLIHHLESCIDRY